MDTAQIHLILNHVPVLGVLIAGIIFTYATVIKNIEVKKVSLYLFVISALFAVPVYFSGESAEEIVEHLPGIIESTIERHEDFAKFALISVELLGALAFIYLGFIFKSKKIPQTLTASILGAYIVTCGILIQTAHLGGQIRHTEIANVQLNMPDHNPSTHYEEDDDD